jgi:hypothetical protein
VIPLDKKLMKEVQGLLDRMLVESSEIVFTTRQCERICERYAITPQQLLVAIKQYCFDKNIKLETYQEIT